MRSTGEGLGLSASYGEAFFKAQDAANSRLPYEGCVLISVNDKDKPEIAEVANAFHNAGFKIVATGRTYKLLDASGIPVTKIKKLYEGRPNILDAMTNGEIQLIVNTPAGKASAQDDSYMRKSAIKYKIPYITTIAAARAAATGIKAIKDKPGRSVKSLQEWHSQITE
jgi:carbamoyl-phosphate synthase large subunit